MSLRSVARCIGHVIGKVIGPSSPPADRHQISEREIARQMDRVDRRIRDVTVRLTEIDSLIAHRDAEVQRCQWKVDTHARKRDQFQEKEHTARRQGRMAASGAVLGCSVGLCALPSAYLLPHAVTSSLLGVGVGAALLGGAAYAVCLLRADDAKFYKNLNQGSMGTYQQSRDMYQQMANRDRAKRQPVQLQLEELQQQRGSLVMRRKEKEVKAMARALNAPPPAPAKIDVGQGYIQIGGVRIQRNTSARP